MFDDIGGEAKPVAAKKYFLLFFGYIPTDWK